jgi:hypothetical protein
MRIVPALDQEGLLRDKYCAQRHLERRPHKPGA